MAKEWGYASHNGESEAAAVRASGSAQRTGPGDAHEAYQCGTLRPGLRLLGPPARSRHSLLGEAGSPAQDHTVLAETSGQERRSHGSRQRSALRGCCGLARGEGAWARSANRRWPCFRPRGRRESRG